MNDLMSNDEMFRYMHDQEYLRDQLKELLDLDVIPSDQWDGEDYMKVFYERSMYSTATFLNGQKPLMFIDDFGYEIIQSAILHLRTAVKEYKERFNADT